MKKILYVLSILIITTTVVLTVYTPKSSKKTNPEKVKIFKKNASYTAKANTKKKIEKEPLELQKGWKLGRGEFGNVVITGTVKNNSKKTYSYVQITFGLYDKDKAKVGSALANINYLAPNQIWKFQAVPMIEEFVYARVEKLDGF